MNSNLINILNILKNSRNLSDSEKIEIEKAIEELDKTEQSDKFKFERAENDKRVLTEKLEESIQDLERKTKAIADQNRELEIETALEKVRSSALAMKQPADMVEVCRIISDQLILLGVNDIRNVQTAIINEQKSTYLNYQYFTAYEKGIVEETNYNKHPKVLEMVQEMKRSADAFFSGSFVGEELDAFRKYRKQDNQFPDPLLDEATAFYYNFYSIGPGGLGLTTYKPLPQATLEIFKRFHSVFSLAYRRFIDIEHAAAQAREAKIETALEKVRAVAMGMNKPDDLLNISETLYIELLSLGFDEIRNAMINIHNDNNKSFLNYDYSDEIGKNVTLLDYNAHPVMERQIMQSRMANDAFSEAVYEGNDLEKWKEFRRKYGEKDDPRIDKIKALYYYFYSIGTGTIGISTFKPIGEEKLTLMKRFRNVFSLAYQRYSDIALAEAQAREAQIELALEKVRSRTTGMQKSEELKEVIQIVYEQFVHLNINIEHTGFIMDYKARDDMHIWLADRHEVPAEVTIPYFDSQHWNSFNEAKEKGLDFFANHLTFEEKNRFYRDLFKLIPGVPEESLEYYFSCPGLAVSTVLLENVGLYIENFSGIPYSDEENNTLMRFGKVFQQTYTRFLDLQKAEAQAREAQIELALERVRGSAMTMHNSEDLSAVTSIIFTELRKLGIQSIRSGVALLSKNSRIGHVYAAATSSDDEFYTLIRSIDMTEHPSLVKQYESWLLQENYLSVLSDEELKSYYQLPFFYSSASYVPPENYNHKEYGYYIPFSEGLFYAWTKKTYSQNELSILNRFKSIIDLTFRRFLDLQKAEALAREAQIELALERVRAKTMAMQKSEELSETAYILFQQFKELDKVPKMITIGIMNEKEGVIEFWVTDWSGGGSKVNRKFDASIEEPILLNKIFLAWKEKRKSTSIELAGKELQDWINYRVSLSGIPDDNDYSNSRGFVTAAFFSKGILSLSTDEPHSVETVQLLERFASVFDLTYTRFLDLRRAEAQAREARIEAALERVRSNTMAMHKSDELLDIVSIISNQLENLNFRFDHVSFGENNQTHDYKFWISIKNQPKPYYIYVPYINNPMFERVKQAQKKGLSFYSDILTPGENRQWHEHVFEHNEVDFINKRLKEYIYKKGYARSIAILPKIMLIIGNYESRPYSAEENNILVRFATVFQQSYTRFLDLKKAEAQAREAQIEAALERVRSETMAMHKSEQLAETAMVLFEQFNLLGKIPDRMSIGIINEESLKAELWLTDQSGKKLNNEYFFRLDEPTNMSKLYRAWKEKKNAEVVDLKGNELNDWLRFIKEEVKLPIDISNIRDRRVQNAAFFSQGFLLFTTHEPVAEEITQLLIRFARVFDLAYTRFLDLQIAETQAREAIKQASLDRIRGEIASMRTADDLNHIIPIIWRELKILEVPFIRCGVFIVDTGNERVQVYLSTPEGKSLGVLNLLYAANKLTGNIVRHWEKKLVYKEHWNKDEFIEWTNSMIKLGQVQNAETYQGSVNPPESLNLHFIPFKQGMLYVGDVSPLSGEKLQLVKYLTQAFSIAYARYEDFKNLEEAKNKIEVTLNELKAAQAQLVHSEKMASLGELTAGIAHEIKNPLNFVTNFSELSRELLDELKEELKNNNPEEMTAIIEDLILNLEKIEQHGKRADSIVKGMLLHSRGTSGEKVLTDINDLLDQYVNLAYHGMRAQDKEFNITIEKDYDKTLEKINVVPQDISRVFLNIINNACYAANENKNNTIDFKPVLKVSTKNSNGKVEIRIKDNGNGIPGDILDKIFQPFFTTKPTGEGTGLGLSLSYDIVTKVHGGELKVDTKEMMFTEFIIILPKKENL